MTEQKEYCQRCHGSGRVGYVASAGRRGHTHCPDCGGSGDGKQSYHTCLLCEGRGDMPIGLGSPSREICRSCQGKGVVYGNMEHHAQILAQQAAKTASGIPKVTSPPANAPQASNAQQTAFLWPSEGYTRRVWDTLEAVDWQRMWEDGLKRLLADSKPIPVDDWYDERHSPDRGKTFDDGWTAWLRD